MITAAPRPAVLQLGATWAAIRCPCARLLVLAQADGPTCCACGRAWRFVLPQVEEVAGE